MDAFSLNEFIFKKKMLLWNSLYIHNNTNIKHWCTIIRQNVYGHSWQSRHIRDHLNWIGCFAFIYTRFDICKVGIIVLLFLIH